jgi:mono/diheme cytochrome c family protein
MTKIQKAGLNALMGVLTLGATSALAQTGNAQQGQKIFAEKCVRCHAEDGSGNSAVGKALGAADLRSADIQKKTDAQFYTQIDKGKGNMPPFGTSLDKGQIDDLVAYVRQIGKKSAKKSH